MSVVALALGTAVAAQLAPIPPGELERVYEVPGESSTVPVGPFALEVDPVTNAEFLAFVQAHPQWRRDQVPALYADEGYLAHWPADGAVGDLGALPVTRVSWFAARAYCASEGRRLPVEDEWERAGAATARAQAAGPGEERPGTLLPWFPSPGSLALQPVGSDPPNYFGVRGLHGQIWEWVEDFNSSFAAADVRRTEESERLGSCGGWPLAASDVVDYRGYMRLAYRSELIAKETKLNLGFRCAADLSP